LKDKLQRLIRFLKKDVWRIRLKSLPGHQSLFLRFLRTLLLALRGFHVDRCSLRASALTFYSILSLVPVVALAFGIAKGFGMEDRFEEQIRGGLAGQEQVADYILNFARNNILRNTQGGLIAGVGVVILVWTVIKVLGSIEKSLNDIWGVKKARSLGRRFTDYLSIMLICPILLVFSGAAQVFLRTKLAATIEGIPMSEIIGPAASAVLKAIPYVLGCAVFAFTYIFMPNTKVRLSSGILAGIVAGLLFQFFQWLYIALQIGVAKYNAVYGSFAALPMFLVWLQISWLVVLFGAELSFAHQNVETYEFEPDCMNVSHAFRRLVGLKITHALVKRFSSGERPLTAKGISQELGAPIRLTNDVLYELVDAGILSTTAGENEQETPGYQPAVTVEKLSLGFVIWRLDQRGSDGIPLNPSESLDRLKEALEKFRESVQESPANVLLRDI